MTASCIEAIRGTRGRQKQALCFIQVFLNRDGTAAYNPQTVSCDLLNEVILMKVHAYAAKKAGARLEPFEYELDEVKGDEIDIQVQHCGVCHSDLSMLDNEWGMSAYPFVPGHEVVGKVKAAGEQITHMKPGDTVGLGWHSGYDMTCDQCLAGHHNMCPSAEHTIVGRHGGFADVVRARGATVFKLPEGLDPKTTGPLFCGGITVFNPLVQFDVKPTSRVAVIGIGGLGHLALQFASKWGCHVTAFTSSESKREQAMKLGAHDILNTGDDKAMKKAAGQFDLILCTVNVPLDWDGLIATLAPRGRLHLVGVQTKPLALSQFPLLMSQLSVSSSPTGGPYVIRQMLAFCARHEIAPVTEHFGFDQVNEAMDHLRAGKARYRIVLHH